jgi:pimeloyl-ACP methyl ester carboxylesterase
LRYPAGRIRSLADGTGAGGERTEAAHADRHHGGGDGEDDPLCPLPVVEELASRLPAGTTRLARLPGARHTIFRDRPDLAFPAVRNFVSQI